jgi:hypothetical protein
MAPPVPTLVDTGTLIVDKNNIKLYREALSAHPKPLWRLHPRVAFEKSEGHLGGGGLATLRRPGT